MTIVRRVPWSRFIITLGLVSGVSGMVLAQDWEARTSGRADLLNGVWFTDANRGFAVGQGGTVLETEDGGQTWSALALTVDDMLDVSFRDGSTGLIVGDNGKIFRTVNAGQDWNEVSSGTESNLSGVAFGSGGLAYAAGRDGTILRSTDSGGTWLLVETGADRYRAATAFGQRAWVVGNDGVMRATNDGGLNWFSPSSGTASDLHDVVFVSADEGWVVGQNNTVLYTNDAGTTWTPRNDSIGIGLNTVFFGNSDLGWIGGRLGDAFHSTDGALTWAGEPTPTLDELNAVHFSDAFHGWAVGDSGTILARVVSSVTLSVDRDGVEWDAAPGDPLYDVVRGDLVTLRTTGGDFSAATDECLAPGILANFVDFAIDPPIPGEGFWFLVRVNPAGDVGTYDSGSFRQAGFRDSEIASSGVDCL
jgi:photosystem II stability/assembly factor-like uncharacterized protein